jgi:hypothetical protein
VPDNRKGSGRKGSYNYYRAALSLATIPLMIGVAPAIGWWFGRLADRKLGTDWVFQAVGVALGIAAAIRETVLLVRRASKDLEE